MLIGYILSIVCLKLNRSSHLSFMQCLGLYPGLYVYSISLVMIVRIRVTTSSYYHHQIGSMTHLRLFKFRSWNNGMRYMSSYVHVFFFIVICRHNSKIVDLKSPWLIYLSLNWVSYIHVLWKSPIIPTKFSECFIGIVVSIIPYVISISKSMPFFNSSMDGCLIWHCKIYARMLRLCIPGCTCSRDLSLSSFSDLA